MKRLIFCLSGILDQNSRALRQIGSLSRLFAITVLDVGDQPSGHSSFADVIRLPKPAGQGPPFFWRLHHNFKNTLASLEADLVHSSDLYALPAAAAYARRLRIPYTYDARELYPDVASLTGHPAKRRFWRSLEETYIKQAAAVFTVSQSIASCISDRYNIRQPTVALNTPSYHPRATSNYLRERAKIPEDHAIVLHQGQMRKSRGCEELLEAISETRRCHLVFLGNGPLLHDLQLRSAKLQLGDRVHFLPPVSPADLLMVTASADIGVTLLQDTCLNHRYALPNKLFEYIMAGIPVIGSDLPEIRNVITSHDVGTIVNQSDVAKLAQTLQDMIDSPEKLRRWSQNALVASELLNWEQESLRFTQLFADVAGC